VTLPCRGTGALNDPERALADGPSMTNHSAIVLYRHGTATTVNWPGAVSTLLANGVAF
jgi:hypothetical protein